MSVLRSVARGLFAVICVALAIPLAVAALEYLYTPVYDFPEPAPFAGAHWYNPYATIAPAAHWLKANFHAHTRAWGGVTNGHQTAAEITNTYRALGYDVIGISNYHRIDETFAAESSYMPSYEYGYSLQKTHRLAIGAHAVNWLDFPFGQTAHHKQLIIDRLRPTTDLIAINHPRMRSGHTAADLRLLANYDFVEALNPFGDSIEEWDAALSSGHAVWILADDDNHDVANRSILGIRWTMIAAASSRRDSVTVALRAGRHYGVRGHLGALDNGLRSLTVRGDTISVACDTTPTRIAFIGQGGVTLAAASGVATAGYVATARDTYVRVEITTPNTTIYLNPVVRWDGAALPHPRPVLNATATWAVRTALLATYVMLAALALRVRRRRAPVSS